MSVTSSAVRPRVLDATQTAALQGWADEIEAWPAGSHVFGHYAERTPRGDVICRTENVTACHAGIADLVDGLLRDTATEAVGTPVIAFKDKLNYKQPGGAGFRPHQDRVAYPGVDRVLSILVALDECTTESGCLFLAAGVEEVLATDDRGVVRDDIAQSLEWSAAELAPGDAVLIDGLAPHFSEANQGDRPRRVLVASYSPTSEGYSRDEYYAARAATMASASERDGRFRISTLADFAGDEVSIAAPAIDRCTHPVPA